MSDTEQEVRPGTPWFFFVLMAAVVTLDVILPTWMPTHRVRTPSMLAEPFYLAFLNAQIGIYAVLVVLIEGWPRARLLSVPLCAVLLHWYLRPFPPGSNELGMSFSTLFAAHWFLVAAAMMGAHAAGWRLRRFTPRQLETTKQKRRQFSLLSLVLAMTVICFLVAMLVRTQLNMFLMVMIVGALMAVPTILVVPLVLVPRTKWVPAILTLAVLSTIIAMAVSRGPNEALLFYGLPMAIQLAVFLLMRCQGYRLWRVAPSLRELQLRRAADLALAATPIAPNPSPGPIEARKSASFPDPNP